MIKVELISKRDYDLKGILDGETDVIEEMLDKSGYLCDAVSETADGNTPIYNGDVWENASDISKYIEEAIAEGIAPTGSNNVDLIRIFQSGYYVFYQSLIYDNLETIVFNYVAEKVNEFLNTLKSTKDIDVDAVESAIEDAVSNIDNNDTYDALDDIANEVIQDIKNGEYPNE